MPTTKSLWPENFDLAPESTPYDLLAVQATELKKATKAKLYGRVDIGSIGDKVSLDFMVIADALNGYEYRLFKVLHRVHPAFEAEFVVTGNRAIKTESREEFESTLANMIQSKETTRLINELLDLIKKKEKDNRRRRT